MKLPDDQKSCLEQLYVQNAIPLCQLLRAPGVLDRIATSFNKLCDTKYEAGVLHRYMVNRRKNRDWPRLGKRARRFKSAYKLLTDHQLKVLQDIYEQLDITSDEYLFSSEFGRMLVREFGKRTGAIIPTSTLVAVVFAKRKRGEWVCIREEIANENRSAAHAFNDLDEVERIFKNKRKQA